MHDDVKCAACGQGMLQEDFGGVVVDVCSTGCRGIWFDSGELEALDSDKLGMGPALARALAQTGLDTPTRPPLDCPRCETRMDRSAHELVPEVAIDACGRCGGTFLDGGELSRVRSRSLTPAEREAAERRRERFERRRAEGRGKNESGRFKPGLLDLVDLLLSGL